MVAELNQLSRVEDALHAFLFGASRVDLSPVRAALLDLGADRCFWCERRLRGEVHVDHVLPWSRFPNDALFNLVLADSPCNLDKRDTLVAPALLGRWVARPVEQLAAASQVLLWPVDRVGSLHSAVAAYAWLPDGVPLWQGPSRVAPSTAADRSTALTVLRAV